MGVRGIRLLTIGIVIGATVTASGCGGDDEGGAEIPPPDPAWKSDFLFAGFTDLSGSPVIEAKSGRYTPSVVKTLEECGAGGEELEQLQASVTKAYPEGGDPDFTTSDGGFTFEFSGAPTRTDPIIEIETLASDEGPCDIFREIDSEGLIEGFSGENLFRAD